MRLLLAFTAAFLAVPAMAGTASADVTNNGTTSDKVGYCNANHIANFNGEENGIGWARSVSKGAIAEQNRQIRTEGTALNTTCTATQGDYDPISNNG